MRALSFILAGLCVAAGVFVDGCVAKQPAFLNGTQVSLGCYVPWNGNLYGLELMSFTTGTYIRFPTNAVFDVQHASASTNDWAWGMLESATSSKTKAAAK